MTPKEVMEIPTMDAFYATRDKLNLTDRQREIFMLKYSRGWRYIDIACELGINQDTVSADMKVILQKLAAISKPVIAHNDDRGGGESG